MWPPDDDLLTAWRAVLAAPLTAGGAFAALVLDPLAAALAPQFPRAHPDDHLTAAGDAVLAFLRRPERYDPGRLRLPAYLRMIARRKMADLLGRDRKHHDGRIPWDAVEHDQAERNEEGGDLPSLDGPALTAVVADFTADEATVFELWKDGEAKTPVFAAALGLAHLPPDDQRAAVYRLKDRIKQRLKRAGRKP